MQTKAFYESIEQSVNHTIRWFSKPKFHIFFKRHKWKGKVQLNAHFSFCRVRKAVGYEIVLREIQRCFLHGAAQNVLFWNSTKAAKVFSLYGQENYVLRIVYVAIHNAPRFEMDFLLSFAMCSFNFIAFKDSPLSFWITISWKNFCLLFWACSFITLAQNTIARLQHHFCKDVANCKGFLLSFSVFGHFSIRSLSSLFSNCHVNDVHVFISRNSAGWKSTFYLENDFGRKKVDFFRIQFHRTFRLFHFVIALMPWQLRQLLCYTLN